MITTKHHFGEIRATVRQMQAGDRIVKHKHSYIHTIGIVRGTVTVVRYAHSGGVDLQFAMTQSMPDMEIPPHIDHEIFAMENDTIVVHMSVPQDEEETTGAKGEDGGLITSDKYRDT